MNVRSWGKVSKKGPVMFFSSLAGHPFREQAIGGIWWEDGEMVT